jgi:hypothetical protein
MEVIMAEEVVTPDEIVAPSATEPASPVETTQPAANGSEPDTNSSEPSTVPSARLREETEKRRKAEEENERLRTELETKNTPPQTPVVDETYPDSDTEKILDSYVKKHGFVSQEELAAQRMQVQAQQDVKDLTTNPPIPGIAYDNKEVRDYAAKNGLPITSKNALVAAYKELNWEKIVEAERLQAIDSYKAGGSGSAELPGPGGATLPPEPELKGKSTKERTRERVRNARQRQLT